MKEVIPTSSAELIDERAMDAAEKQAETEALSEAGEKHLAVSEVQELEREHFYSILIGQAQGTDGAALNGDLENQNAELPDEMKDQIDDRVEENHETRMDAIEATPNAHVFTRTSEMAGFQDDDTRDIGLADDIVADPDLLERVSKHESEHARQEKGDQVAEIPPTGDLVIDQERGKLRRLIFREDKAVKAEGGLAGHTAEYHGYVKTADAVRNYLNENGEDGNRLAEDAAEKAEGFSKLREAIRIAAVRKRIKEQSREALAV